MSKTKKFIPLITGVAIAIGVFIGGKLNFDTIHKYLISSNA